MTTSVDPLHGKALWLVGESIVDSPSPRMHNAALAALHLPQVYQLRPTEVAAIDTRLDEAMHLCRGINVTAPFKVTAFERFHEAADHKARFVGAVNTVVFDDARAVLATNTDVDGLLFAWKRASIKLDGAEVAIVGAGGAARAVVAACVACNVKAVSIHTRDSPSSRERKQALCQRIDATNIQRLERPTDPKLVVLAASHLDSDDDIIAQLASPQSAIHDLRYGEKARASRQAALTRRHVYLDGLSMLLGQGRACLSHFLGTSLSKEADWAMAQALTAQKSV